MYIGYEGNFFEDSFVMETNDDVDISYELLLIYISVRLWSFCIDEFDWAQGIIVLTTNAKLRLKLVVLTVKE